ncbi:hypothetical protein [Novosphingobium rosa]|uniref:hypothetical protein n=1 Tax=Novosphingobium rosa TaxID=76978 RepID=UPI00082FB432|nr:hypothetical protein [Novosphingobium rosa]
MASRLTIFQLVAQHLGQDEEILDPDDDTKLIRACKVVWDMARRAALRGNNWNFAVHQGRLAPMNEAPLHTWRHKFILPDDFVRLVDVVGSMADSRDWVLQGGVLMANRAPLDILYVRDETNVALWDDSFAENMSWKLAAQIAINITGDANVAEWCEKKFQGGSGEAQAIDAVENPPQEFDTDSWLNARWMGGGGGPLAYGFHGR